MKAIKVNTDDAVKNATLSVDVHVVYGWRTRVALLLMRLACWFLRCHVKATLQKSPLTDEEIEDLIMNGDPDAPKPQGLIKAKRNPDRVPSYSAFEEYGIARHPTASPIRDAVLAFHRANPDQAQANVIPFPSPATPCTYPTP